MRYRCLILRDLPGLRAFTRDYLLSEEHNDDAITQILEDDEDEPDEALSIVLNATACRALAFFDFALQTVDTTLVERACVSAGNGSAARGGSWCGFALVDRSAVQKFHRRFMGAFPTSQTTARRSGWSPGDLSRPARALRDARCTRARHRKSNSGLRNSRPPNVRPTFGMIL